MAEQCTSSTTSMKQDRAVKHKYSQYIVLTMLLSQGIDSSLLNSIDINPINVYLIKSVLICTSRQNYRLHYPLAQH